MDIRILLIGELGMVFILIGTLLDEAVVLILGFMIWMTALSIAWLDAQHENKWRNA